MAERRSFVRRSFEFYRFDEVRNRSASWLRMSRRQVAMFSALPPRPMTGGSSPAAKIPDRSNIPEDPVFPPRELVVGLLSLEATSGGVSVPCFPHPWATAGTPSGQSFPLQNPRRPQGRRPSAPSPDDGARKAEGRSGCGRGNGRKILRGRCGPTHWF